MAQLRAENLSLTEKLRLSEEKAHRKEQEAIEAEDEIRSQNSVIREAQMTIHLHQQDILNWMALCEWYQVRCLHCSNVLSQMTSFLQGTSVEDTTLAPSQA